MTGRIAAADRLATAAHAGQVDKLGVPYMEHVRAVADAVRDFGEEFQIVGLLHDSLEDCDDRTIVSYDRLVEHFGVRIADAVDAMTKRSGEAYMDGYLPRVLANPIARVVKRADVAHNLGRAHLLPPEPRARLEAKYAQVLAVIGRNAD